MRAAAQHLVADPVDDRDSRLQARFGHVPEAKHDLGRMDRAVRLGERGIAREVRDQQRAFDLFHALFLRIR
jgi:hypothetical protein